MSKPTSKTLLRPLADELSVYRGKRVFFEKLEGNNGDKLIEMGGLEVLRKTGVKLVDKPQQAEAIVINGGAGMTDIWSHGFQKLRKYNSLHSDIPLIILPSSFVFTKTDFPSLFKDRVAPAFVYARERYSLEILENLVFPENVSLGLDHDMAFALQNTSYIEKLRSSRSQKHILIVERNDPESVTGVYKARQAKQKKNSLKKAIPWSVKRPINRRLLWPLKRISLSQTLGDLGTETAFAKDWHRKILQDCPSLEGLPVYAADISDPALCSFSRFSQLIAQSSVVVATRLHVGILAAMLDKKTYLISGSYHKIPGIFEYSLVNNESIQLSSSKPNDADQS